MVNQGMSAYNDEPVKYWHIMVNQGMLAYNDEPGKCWHIMVNQGNVEKKLLTREMLAYNG